MDVNRNLITQRWERRGSAVFGEDTGPGTAPFVVDFHGLEQPIAAQFLVDFHNRLLFYADELSQLVRQAAIPGGLGHLAFGRRGGWLDRATAVLLNYTGQWPCVILPGDVRRAVVEVCTADAVDALCNNEGYRDRVARQGLTGIARLSDDQLIKAFRDGGWSERRPDLAEAIARAEAQQERARRRDQRVLGYDQLVFVVAVVLAAAAACAESTPEDPEGVTEGVLAYAGTVLSTLLVRLTGKESSPAQALEHTKGFDVKIRAGMPVDVNEHAIAFAKFVLPEPLSPED